MRHALHDVWLSCALVAACSLACNSEKNAAPPAPPPAAPAEAPAAPAAPAAQPEAVVIVTPDEAGVVHVTGSDQMRFSAGRINVKAGGTISIELKNAGTLPKEAMGHNLVVLKPGTDPMAFAMKAVSAKATDYMPADASDQVIAHTKLLGPGESDTIKFPAPAAGTYPFVCTFPGHAAIMKGVLVVE